MSNEELHELYINALHELNHEKLRREAFEKDVEMHKKMNNLLADRAAGVIVERDRLKSDVDQLNADLTKMVAWGRGLEHDKRLLQEENARLKAEVERLEVMKERLNDARKVIDDLHAITKTSNADKLVEFVQVAADTIGAQAVELDDLRARLRT